MSDPSGVVSTLAQNIHASSVDISYLEITEAEALLDECEYDSFRGSTASGVRRGLDESSFKGLVDCVAAAYEIDYENKNLLLNMACCDTGLHIVKDFKCEKGKGGVIYGKAAICKKGQKIDFAYIIYTSTFSLRPSTKVGQIEKKFLGNTYEVEEKEVVTHRALKHSEKQCLEKYFFAKAVEGFKKELSQCLQLK